MHLGTNYNVNLVGTIPTGLPQLQVPKMGLLSSIAADSIAIAVVSYAVLMSVAKTFAKKHNYAIRPNQELLATGLANIMGSFFSCMPTGCALARSVIQEQTGGKTQIASLVSAGLILLVILFIGPFFEMLPRCVLSSIIVVALKAMLFQIKNVKGFYVQDPLDAFTWIVTFLAVVLIDIDVGLLCGVAMALITMYFRGIKSHACSLGVVPGTEIYVDLESHKRAMKVNGVIIWRYSGSVNFTSAASVKKKLYTVVESGNMTNLIKRDEIVSDEKEISPLNKEVFVENVILDLSCVARLDYAACKTLLEIKSDLKKKGLQFVLAGANDRVYDMLLHAFLNQRDQIDIFVTVHDAVLAVKAGTAMEV